MVDETKENVRGDNVAFENAEVKILDIEKVLDTDPELYKNRALDALEKQYYLDAMAEAEKAIEYGRNERKYQIVKAKVLLARGEYNSFLVYILRETQLWEYKDISFELTNEEKDFLLYGFSVSYGQLGYPPDKLPEIILTADGKGMCKSIQEAVEKYSDKKIMLTGGWYNEDIDIDGKTIRIIGSKYSKPKINGRWKINNSFCTISNLLFHNQSDRAGIMLEIDNSKFNIENLSFNSTVVFDSSAGDLLGMAIDNSVSKKDLMGMKFNNLTAGIVCSDSYICITKSDFSDCKSGVLCHNKKSNHMTSISDCIFRQNYMGCLIMKNGGMTIQYSRFENNDFAIMLNSEGLDGEVYVDGNEEKVVVKNCYIIGSKIVAIGNDGGTCIVKDSHLKNNAREYFVDSGGTLEKERVTETGNTAAGPLVEGVKSVFKALFS